MWFKYVVIASFAIEAIGYIGLIGEERPSITKAHAVVQMIVSTLFILGIIHYWK